MSELASELRTIFEELQSAVHRVDDLILFKPVDALEKSAKEVEKAWGHSWVGYQSRVYYEGLQPPPPGAHFSSELGFRQMYTMGTRGDWREFPDGAVEARFDAALAIQIHCLPLPSPNASGRSSNKGETT